MSDDQIARVIRGDQIDILIDLTMHMAHGRPLVLARKPAPVQAAWLAYPGTTGISAVDYRLTDPYLDPPGQYDQCYAERSIRLPDTFWCYDAAGTLESAAEMPAVTPLSAERNGFITFGCFNNICKLNDDVFELWATVMRQVASSRMVIWSPPGLARRWITESLNRRGIDAGRLDFVGRQPRPKFLAEFGRVDLCLDTTPYNGHTTSLDALWMGAPVISLIGKTVVGRAGLSQLSNLGLAELAAPTDEQFVGLARLWGADIPRLSELRRSLRGRMMESPLTDGRRFAQGMEAAYRQMWRTWCRR
jgi:predicted O-linked N-acetylglucosamine transferase (SPINDLY family)